MYRHSTNLWNVQIVTFNLTLFPSIITFNKSGVKLSILMPSEALTVPPEETLRGANMTRRAAQEI